MGFSAILLHSGSSRTARRTSSGDRDRCRGAERRLWFIRLARHDRDAPRRLRAHAPRFLVCSAVLQGTTSDSSPPSSRRPFLATRAARARAPARPPAAPTIVAAPRPLANQRPHLCHLPRLMPVALDSLVTLTCWSRLDGLILGGVDALHDFAAWRKVRSTSRRGLRRRAPGHRALIAQLARARAAGGRESGGGNVDPLPIQTLAPGRRRRRYRM